LLQLLSWVALTESWVAFSGLSGYVSLGHAVFYGLGAYIMALLWQEAPIWQILPLAGMASVILAIVIGYPALRVRGPYFVILTLGLSEFIKYIVVALEAAIGSSGRLLLGTPDPEVLYYLLLALAIVATALTFWLSRSRWGVGLRAIREDETAAGTLGVPVAFLKTGAFALSAFIPGVSIVTIAIVGGSDQAPGPILGATFIVILSELLWARAPQVYLVLLGLLLIFFVLFLPRGIYGQIAAFYSGKRR
jgi:branched-chain amino acid transport system permease protein